MSAAPVGRDLRSSCRWTSPRRSRVVQRQGKRHLPDAPSGLTRLDRLLPALEGLSGAKLRVWSQAAAPAGTMGVQVLAGPTPAWTAWLNGTRDSGRLETPE